MNENSKFVLYCLLSACCGPCDSAHHEAARGQLHPRQRALQASLVVLRQTPAARHPGEGPLDDPPAVENLETFCVSTVILRSRRRPWRRSVSRGRPLFAGGGRHGSTKIHSSSVKSLSNRARGRVYSVLVVSFQGMSVSFVGFIIDKRYHILARPLNILAKLLNFRSSSQEVM